jgi:hypothetical protein
VKVAVSGLRGKDVCSLSVRYAGGVVQGSRPATVGPGRPLWRWTIPADARAGTARVSVSCKAAGSITRPLVVKSLPLRIDVLKQGFSVKAITSRSTVSYGVLLANRSKTYDAAYVTVLVNFVMANNDLIGSVTKNVGTIPASSQYALGDSVSFPSAAPVARLEIVVHVGDKQPAVRTPVPATSNVRIVAGLRDPDWLEEVDAEVANVTRNRVLTGGTVKVIVMDAAGEVVGGGSGSMSGTLPPGARQLVKVTSGLDSIPTADARSAIVTIVPRYQSDYCLKGC